MYLIIAVAVSAYQLVYILWEHQIAYLATSVVWAN